MSVSGFQITLTTLARTPNQSAAETLVSGITGTSAAVRNGSIAALARRSDEASQRELIEVFSQFTSEESAALVDLPRKLKKTLVKMLGDEDIDSSRAACEFIRLSQAFDEIPALVTTATQSDHPGCDLMAATALELVNSLRERLMEYRQQPSGRDPSFARRWALAALTKAVSNFEQHGHAELLEAFLLTTTANNETLREVLSNRKHAAHEPLLTLLHESNTPGVAEILARMFDMPKAPKRALEIVAERNDERFRSDFLEAIDLPISKHVQENVGRLENSTIVGQPSDEWLQWSSAAQVAAVEFTNASNQSIDDKLKVFNFVLSNCSTAARVASCFAMSQVDHPAVKRRLEKLLRDSEAPVVVAAGKALRPSGSQQAVSELASLLDHEDEQVRQAARRGLSDFTLQRFLSEYDRLDENARVEYGRMVLETDPDAIDHLQREIAAAPLERKLRGIEVAVLIGAVDHLSEDLIKLASHNDAAVRAEAIDSLAGSSSEVARGVLEAATSDPNALVRNRATESLERWQGQATLIGAAE